MNFSCIILRANSMCETKGIDKRIYTKSGAGKDFVSNIKKGSAPSVEKVYALADYLDCSIDYLLGRTDNPQVHVKSTETNNELIALIKQLTPEQQELVAAQIKGIISSKINNPPPKGDG